MDYVVSYSGGLGSFCAAHRLLQTASKDDHITLLFCDTLIEEEDLYRFVDHGAKALGLELVKIADGRTPWEVFKDKKYQGNTRTAHCSQRLKTDVVRKWMSENCLPAYHSYSRSNDYFIYPIGGTCWIYGYHYR